MSNKRPVIIQALILPLLAGSVTACGSATVDPILVRNTAPGTVHSSSLNPGTGQFSDAAAVATPGEGGVVTAQAGSTPGHDFSPATADTVTLAGSAFRPELQTMTFPISHIGLAHFVRISGFLAVSALLLGLGSLVRSMYTGSSDPTPGATAGDPVTGSNEATPSTAATTVQPTPQTTVSTTSASPVSSAEVPPTTTETRTTTTTSTEATTAVGPATSTTAGTTPATEVPEDDGESETTATTTAEPTPASTTSVSSTTATTSAEPTPASTTSVSSTTVMTSAEPTPASTTSVSSTTVATSAEPTPAEPTVQPEPKSERELALEELQKQVNRAEQLIPRMGVYGESLKGLLRAPKAILANPQHTKADGIRAASAQLEKFTTQFVGYAGIDETSDETAEEARRAKIRQIVEQIRTQYEPQARGIGLRVNIDNALSRAQAVLDDPEATLEALATEERTIAIDRDRIGEQFDAEQQKIQQHDEQQAAAKAELAARPITPWTLDGETQHITVKEIYDVAQLVKKTLPDGRTADSDPEYDDFDSIDAVVGGFDGPGYRQAKALMDDIHATIRAEIDDGKGYFYTKDKDQWVQYVLPAEDVATLQPIMALNDRYSQRMLVNINTLRRNLGLNEYTLAPLSDYQKAQMIVHGIAEYEQGLHGGADGGPATGHTRTKAIQLVPHEQANGWNENYYGSYNNPETASHMTPEFLADEFFNLVLNESENFRDNPDDLAAAGHFLNAVSYGFEYFYGAITPGEITDQPHGQRKYRVSMTDFFYKLATEKDKEFLENL
ncbi:hypothetical protein [Corynebacterium sp. CCM 9204]|uniref:hypothetical protein n=1 Tax=Corynebacterium sp. CCM 9204 TaxID=3057616 RepID=UPI0035245347